MHNCAIVCTQFGTQAKTYSYSCETLDLSFIFLRKNMQQMSFLIVISSVRNGHLPVHISTPNIRTIVISQNKNN